MTTNLDNLTDTTSRCVAKFYIFKNRATLTGNDTVNAMDAASFVEDDDIISCSISREKASCIDNFQLIMKPKRANWANIIKPGDWVMIYLDDIANINLETKSGLRCIGNVDRIARNDVTQNDGSRVTTITVSGSGWGKVLEGTEMFYNPYASPALKETFIQQLGFAIQGSPLNFVNGYLDIFLGSAKDQGLPDIIFPMLIPSELYRDLQGQEYSKNTAPSFNDILVRDFNINTDEGYSQFRNVSRIMSGSLWQTLQQCCNGVVNELFTDIRDGKPTIIFRKIPMTTQLRQDLANQKIIELPQSFIINSNLGSSDHEIFNYLSIFATDSLIQDISYFAAGMFSDHLPIVAKDSTKRFGLRRIDRNTEYAWDKNSTLGIQILNKWADDNADYWFNYYHFESGTIDVKGKVDFEIGTFIKIPEKNKVYLVESIEWDWSYGDAIMVSLTVTTGLNSDLTFTDTTRNIEEIPGTTVYERVTDKNFSTPLGPDILNPTAATSQATAQASKQVGQAKQVFKEDPAEFKSLDIKHLNPGQ